MGMNVMHQKYSGVRCLPRQITMQKCWWLISKAVWLYCIFFLALKPKFAASEKIKELSTELVMVNVEASEKLIITFTMFTMFT